MVEAYHNVRKRNKRFQNCEDWETLVHQVYTPVSPSNKLFQSPSLNQFLCVNSPCLEKYFIWNPSWSHLSRSLKNFLPGNTQLLHSPKSQRKQQKPRNKPPTQQTKTRYEHRQYVSTKTQQRWQRRPWELQYSWSTKQRP